MFSMQVPFAVAMNTNLPLAFLFDGIGSGEVVLVFVAVLLLFGPRRLPEIARSIGKTLSDLRRASRDFQDQIMRMDEPDLDRPAPLASGETAPHLSASGAGLDASVPAVAGVADPGPASARPATVQPCTNTDGQCAQPIGNSAAGQSSAPPNDESVNDCHTRGPQSAPAKGGATDHDLAG
jgi:TatA/E family protein of Tat protein translocase